MEVSVVIPNYNGEKLLQKNLPKVIEALSFYLHKFSKKGEIIITDDSSRDKSEEIAEEIFKSNKSEKIKFVFNRNKKNLGFSSNVNKGVEKVHGRYIVLLNTDIEPEKDFLVPLLKNFEDPQMFAVGCLEESVEVGGNVLRGRGLGCFKRGFLNHRKGEVDRGNTLWVSGGSGAFRKDIWDKLSGFDSLYNPFYWEDIDLSYRALKSGYKTKFENRSKVKHEHERGAIKTNFSKNSVKKIAYRNQFIFTWKNLSDFDLLFIHFLLLPYHFIKSFLSFDWAFFSGFRQAYCLLPQIKKSRREAGKLFLFSDKKVIAPYCQ